MGNTYITEIWRQKIWKTMSKCLFMWPNSMLGTVICLTHPCLLLWWGFSCGSSPPFQESRLLFCAIVECSRKWETFPTTKIPISSDMIKCLFLPAHAAKCINQDWVKCSLYIESHYFSPYNLSPFIHWGETLCSILYRSLSTELTSIRRESW